MKECPWCGWPCRGKACPEHRGLDLALREVYDPPVLTDRQTVEAALPARERDE